jgi:hypothetical protein
MGATHIVLVKASEDVLRAALQTAWRLRVEANPQSGKRTARRGHAKCKAERVRDTLSPGAAIQRARQAGGCASKAALPAKPSKLLKENPSQLVGYPDMIRPTDSFRIARKPSARGRAFRRAIDVARRARGGYARQLGNRCYVRGANTLPESRVYVAR